MKSNKPLRAFIREQFKKTRALSRRRQPDAEDFHEMRLILKRLRAADRLFDKQLKSSAKKKLRKLSHSLGPLRDHEIVTQWAVKHSREISPRARRYLRPNGSESTTPPQTFMKAIDGILKLESRFKPVKRRGLSNKKIEVAFANSLKRFQKAYAKARTEFSPTACHRMRRRAKDLIYQLQALDLDQETSYRELYRSLKATEKLLGDSHDLVLVEEELRARNIPLFEELQKLEASQMILNRRALITAESKLLGEGLRRPIKGEGNQPLQPSS